MGRGCGDNYPFDFDASLRHTRIPDAVTLHPHPPMIGMLSGLLPLFDQQFILPQSASSGWGPMVGVLEVDQSPWFTDTALYSLPKVEG